MDWITILGAGLTVIGLLILGVVLWNAKIDEDKTRGMK